MLQEKSLASFAYFTRLLLLLCAFLGLAWPMPQGISQETERIEIGDGLESSVEEHAMSLLIDPIGHDDINTGCSGSVSLKWAVDEPDGPKQMSIILQESIRNVPRRYPAYRASLTDILLLYEATGNCCWSLYKRNRYRGKPIQLSPGQRAEVTTDPVKSVKKIECQKEQ